VNPFEFLRELSLHYSGSGWRAYENPIGQPIFYKGFTENMKGWILASDKLQHRIADLAEKRIAVEEAEGRFGNGNPEVVVKKKEARRREIHANLREVCDKWADGMICKLENKRFIRVSAGMENGREGVNSN